MTKTNPTDRLTEREKQALRGWLERKTAKEIALDLGISHHAVEKRLKMARTKLDAGTSLEAARILAEAEPYGQTVAASTDLQTAPEIDDLPYASPDPATNNRRKIMIVSTSLGLALMMSASQQQTQNIDGPAVVATLEKTLSSEVETAQDAFERLDHDKSGFIEAEEFVSSLTQILAQADAEGIQATLGTVAIDLEDNEIVIEKQSDVEPGRVQVKLDNADTRARRETMFGLIDRNKDGRVDVGEFTIAHIEGLSPRTLIIEELQEEG